MDEVFQKSIKSLPRSPGVYLFSNRQGRIIYVGKAINLFERIKTYLTDTFEPKTRAMVCQIAKIGYLKALSEFDGLLLEAALIKKYQPRYNVRLKDDKSFLYIAITKDEFPRVLATRKNDIVNPRYLFGPFPSAKTVRRILQFLRKIFPYCSQKGTGKPCFWSHLGLCNPCPGEIPKLTGEEKRIKKKIYLTNIKNLAKVLSKKSKKIVGILTSQMEEAAKREDYEEAASLRDQIEKLSWLLKPHFPVSSYLENVNFSEEIQEKELTSLYHYLSSLISKIPFPHRIECYDVSNIVGLYSTGSMVVFIDGFQSKDGYRRFKIKISSKPNDIAMISEVLKRRLKHKDWEYPQLVIIDGGKGQVSGAIAVLREEGLTIPIIGLAKGLEEIVVKMERPAVAGSSGIGEWKVERLPDDSPALNLLKRIRDEAHRFALVYHRKLRTLEFDIK